MVYNKTTRWYGSCLAKHDIGSNYGVYCLKRGKMRWNIVSSFKVKSSLNGVRDLRDITFHYPKKRFIFTLKSLVELRNWCCLQLNWWYNQWRYLIAGACVVILKQLCPFLLSYWVLAQLAAVDWFEGGVDPAFAACVVYVSVFVFLVVLTTQYFALYVRIYCFLSAIFLMKRIMHFFREMISSGRCIAILIFFRLVPGNDHSWNSYSQLKLIVWSFRHIM